MLLLTGLATAFPTAAAQAPLHPPEAPAAAAEVAAAQASAVSKALQREHPQAVRQAHVELAKESAAARVPAPPSSHPPPPLLGTLMSSPMAYKPLALGTLPYLDTVMQSTPTAAVPLQARLHHAEALLGAQQIPASNTSQLCTSADTPAMPASLHGIIGSDTALPPTCLPSNPAAPTLPRVQHQPPPHCHTSSVQAAKVLVAIPPCSAPFQPAPTTPLPTSAVPASAAAAAAGSPNHFSTPPASIEGPSMAGVRNEAEQTPVSQSGDPCSARSNSGANTVVTNGPSHDDGYRSALCYPSSHLTELCKALHFQTANKAYIVWTLLTAVSEHATGWQAAILGTPAWLLVLQRGGVICAYAHGPSCSDITTCCRWSYRSTNRMKGHAHPRMYYKCTAPGCLARKHTEVSATDDTQLVTTYVGIHIHTIPVAGDDGSKEGQNCNSRLPAADGQARGILHRALLFTCNASSTCQSATSSVTM